ncbi:MAG: hypothetical protein LQ339_004672 [Xanthoria mediterranea]|nr:MAG: hypothetical protein LQ339_004672 [Xanthoria mediterranea]
MGVQAYLTRLALGRSAYERLSHGDGNGPDSVGRTAPLTQLSNQQSDHVANFQNEPPNQGDGLYIQQYDNRGYPQNPGSRALSRRSRRAQNDVLATVGVLLYPDQFAQETPHAQKQSEPSSAQTQQDVAVDSILSYTLYDTYLALDILSHSYPPSPERNHRAAGSERNITRRASRSGSNDWQADVEGSELGITAPRSFYRPTDPSKPTYRVTQFSTLMVNTLATTLSSIAADILLLPLEALFVRSVASTYLNTPCGAAYSTMGLRHEIYPLRSWAGMGLGGGRVMDYVRKMMLCFGVDILLRFAVWQATAEAAWWVGEKKQFKLRR